MNKVKNTFSIFSILLSLLSILGVIYQNYRLSTMYIESSGKTRALFGLTELRELDIKVLLGVLTFLGLILWYIAFRRNEGKRAVIVALLVFAVATLLLFIRLWTFMV